MNSKHLAIVRAALTYWDEEMGAASEDFYQHYLHSKDQGTVLAPADVAKTRRFFNQVELKFALLERESNELVTGVLVEHRRELACLPSQRIVSVLIT